MMISNAPHAIQGRLRIVFSIYFDIYPAGVRSQIAMAANKATNALFVVKQKQFSRTKTTPAKTLVTI